MDLMQCEVCPFINIKNNDGAICSVKYCILEAALKHAKANHEVCGKEVELKLEENLPTEAQVDEAFQESEVIEGELVE